MSEIDPVEFGEMKSNITHTMNTVGEIKGLLTSSLEKFDDAKDEAERAHARINTLHEVEEAKVSSEAKHRKKMGIIYGMIATVAGFTTSLVKWIFE